ncbi:MULTISPECIES: flagellar export protein FliJ [Bacillus]|uniref:Flagellar FliJ protein n=2 Tax=Bacillus TaxID=1386 RepID=A0A0M5JDS3_9BACI|nr:MULTISPECIES: flagellar export protein FliJ [Bacillus]ALC81057.1 flagellar biosynthesis chaperone [Bacillus gobiensis]MBP1080017.1 flagellar FliJ protein [Bacillus capparidis]
MAFAYKFQKLFVLKENEKNQSFAMYQKSVDDFEKAAEKLYENMKLKEELEKSKDNKLQNGMSIQEMRHYQRFCTNLETTIFHYQQLVLAKRNHMNEKQEELTEISMELKKYEKMKEKQKLSFLTQENAVQIKEMDELSMKQFMFQGS